MMNTTTKPSYENEVRAIERKLRKVSDAELRYVHKDVTDALCGLMTMPQDVHERFGSRKLVAELTACQNERARRHI